MFKIQRADFQCLQKNRGTSPTLSSRSSVITNTQSDRTIRHIRLPRSSHLGILRKIAIGSERIRQIITNLRNSIVCSEAVECGYDRISYVVQKDEIDSVGACERAVRRQATVRLEEIGIIVIGDAGVGRVVSVGAEVVRCSVAWCQSGRLTTNDAATWVRAFGVEVVVCDRWVDARLDLG